jgi:hypothetical protein
MIERVSAGGRGAVAAAWLALVALGLGAARLAGPLFLIDDTHKAQVTISWPTRSGQPVSMQVELAWTSPNERTAIDHGLQAFAAMGGSRLEKGAGNPSGAVVRTGFYKADNTKPFFEDLAQGGAITIVMTNVLFNQPGVPRPATVLQHLKYMPEDVAACGLGDTALDQFNTASMTDTLKGKITVANGRLGVLDGSSPAGGSAKFEQAADGSITMTAVIPYALFRHVRDPWQRTNPGTFFEPTHFHVEFEVLPTDVAAELDARPAAETAPQAAN